MADLARNHAEKIRNEHGHNKWSKMGRRLSQDLLQGINSLKNRARASPAKAKGSRKASLGGEKDYSELIATLKAQTDRAGMHDPTPSAPYEITRTCITGWQDTLHSAAKAGDLLGLQDSVMV